MYKLNGRDVEINGLNFEDHEFYLESASYVDTGTELDEVELEQLVKLHAQELYEDAYMKLVRQAEAACEGDR